MRGLRAMGHLGSRLEAKSWDLLSSAISWKGLGLDRLLLGINRQSQLLIREIQATLRLRPPFFFFLRSWMRAGGLPTCYSSQARPGPGPSVLNVDS